MWAYRDPKTDLYDARVMNFVRVVAIVTRDPGAEDVEEVFETLRDPFATVSFQKYLSNTCLDRRHIELLVLLLDLFTGTAGTLQTYLPGKHHYDEVAFFRRIIEEGNRLTYADLVRFFAYAHFLRTHGTSAEADRFSEWMRVIRNLTINSNIERPAQFKGALRSVSELLSQSSRILEFLREDEFKLEVFSGQQIREERIKAGLILKSDRWKKAVLTAEKHGYFDGQIEFLLDFCGVLDAWGAGSSCDWDEEQDDEYFSRFTEYFTKASLLFNEKGLIPLGEYRTERALLAIGDYTFEKGLNKSLLEDSDDPISWKRLLRGERLGHAGHRRGYVKQLLDKIDTDGDVWKSLDEVIGSATVSEEWQRLMVSDPRHMGCCKKRQFRWCSDTNVYLLSGVRMSGDHYELFSYQLYLEVLSAKSSIGGFTPFGNPLYVPVHTDAYEPWITLSCVDGSAQLALDIENRGSKFKVEVYAKTGEIRDVLKDDFEGEPGFGVDKNGHFFTYAKMDDVEGKIDKVVEIVRRHVAQ